MWDFRIGTALGLMAKTLPFILFRLAVYFGVALAYVLMTGVGAGVGWGIGGFGDEGFRAASTFWGGVAGFGIVGVIMYVLREYLLYMVKAGHIAVLVELLEGHSLPQGRSQIPRHRLGQGALRSGQRPVRRGSADQGRAEGLDRAGARRLSPAADSRGAAVPARGADVPAYRRGLYRRSDPRLQLPHPCREPLGRLTRGPGALWPEPQADVQERRLAGADRLRPLLPDLPGAAGAGGGGGLSDPRRLVGDRCCRGPAVRLERQGGGARTLRHHLHDAGLFQDHRRADSGSGVGGQAGWPLAQVPQAQGQGCRGPGGQRYSCHRRCGSVTRGGVLCQPSVTSAVPPRSWACCWGPGCWPAVATAMRAAPAPAMVREQRPAAPRATASCRPGSRRWSRGSRP